MSATSSEISSPVPWYRQRWPWYVIGLLLLGILATSVLIVSAVDHPDPLVVDDYYKEGLAINRVLDLQRRAAAMGLEAKIQYSATKQILKVHLQARQKIHASSLVLRFVHATLANRDYQVILQRTATGDYQASLPALRQGIYDLLLEPDSGTWRLDAHLELPVSTWSMKPEP